MFDVALDFVCSQVAEFQHGRYDIDSLQPGTDQSQSRKEMNLSTGHRLKLGNCALASFRFAKDPVTEHGHLVGADDEGRRPGLCHRLSLAERQAPYQCVRRFPVQRSFIKVAGAGFERQPESVQQGSSVG